ncbi:MAG TPA: hypothetical protein VFC73_06250 [Syntrophomonadaceae bacterium]|nr:hypothetical protein [Syntrophomonadaceae bacterium]
MDKWYLPAYRLGEFTILSPNQLTLDRARCAANEKGLLPLYSWYSPSCLTVKAFHERVLEQIAYRRMEELQSLGADGLEDTTRF